MHAWWMREWSSRAHPPQQRTIGPLGGRWRMVTALPWRTPQQGLYRPNTIRMAFNFRQKADLEGTLSNILDKNDLKRYLMYFNGRNLDNEVNTAEAFSTVTFNFID